MADRHEAQIAPVALPAGQFELGELESALDHATSVKNVELHAGRIGEAIVKTIRNPELLARADAPAVPTGAVITKQDVVHVEGQEPLSRDAVAFKGVDAKNGAEAAEMSYPTSVEEEAAPEDVPETLAEQAAERIVDESDTASSKAGAKNK